MLFSGLLDRVFWWLTVLHVRSLISGRFLGSRKEKALWAVLPFFKPGSELPEALVLGAWLLWESLGDGSEGGRLKLLGK